MRVYGVAAKPAVGLEERTQPEEGEEEDRQEVMPVVQELKEELQKLKERREERELDAVRREMQRLEEERGGAQDVCVSALRSNMIDRKTTTGRKRKSCENLVSSENKRNRGRGNTRTNKQNLVSSENKRNRGRGNTRTNKQSSAVKEKCDGALKKIGDLIHSSPSILGSTAKSIMGLVSGHSVEKEVVQRPKRGRRKLFKMDATLQDSPDAMSGRANEEKESDHLIIKRQLRSKTCRK
ncbi:kinesin-like protein KIF20B [Gymnodraco acuticeps]|uniref:Kinesin-like protein KIF20B n=1 Tax=Gymnodraco acuticeps TaxID=8218 RepID=A0A6P8SUR4_GYMAC|nr:kinesin-like protein KIF20B [Gymnodraco acuticeps]